MLRKAIGMAVEWALGYEHVINVRLEGDGRMPFRKYTGDAGYDLYCSRRTPILPGRSAEVPSGLYVSPKSRLWLEIKARSSTLKVRGLEVVDAVIDQQYRGELMAIVYNPTGSPAYIEVGDRVAQVIPHLLIPLRFRLGPLAPSDRSSNGFGSTGSGL